MDAKEGEQQMSRETEAATDKFQRELMRGSLDLMVLAIIARGRQYGYSIQKHLDAASEGRIAIPAGTLYPLLHRLESQGLVASSWDESTGRKRKWYEITNRGRKALGQQSSTWHSYVDCVRTLLDGSWESTAPTANP